MKSIYLVVAVLGLAACAPATPSVPAAGAAPPVREIRLPMGYIPSVQYANFYVADARGYFAQEGLRLTYDYLFETNGVQLVGAGELPFAVVSAEQVLLARAQGLPVVYVMAWFQEFPVAVVSPVEAGIVAPEDLRGKHIGLPTLDGANFVGLQALLAAAGVAMEEVSISAIGFNQVEALSAGQVDAVVVYSNNEPIRLAALGQRLNVIEVSDHVRLSANGIITNEDTIATDPDLIRAFVRAVLRGTQDVLADPDAAYAITREAVPSLRDDALERQVLAATMALWKTPTPGWSDPAGWEAMQSTLLQTGLLRTPLDLEQAFTNAFVP